MTCGIYVLRFKGTGAVYVGQSIDIEDRLIKHRSAFTRGMAAPKLQAAYYRYGMPSLEVILECGIPELNLAEKEAIDIFDSVNSGFNTLTEAGNPVLFGDATGNSKHSNEDYLRVLELLVQASPSLNKREISELTGVSIYTVRHIAALESHAWMQEVRPELYAQLVHIKNSKPYYYGTQYPKIISPEGVVYEVEHVTNFAKKHGLLQPKLSEVLRGNRNHHKGWKLFKDTTHKVEA